ncbi:MAG TPA: hypothetical protein EYH56_00280 [Nanoarchaeota archaeon]|nr:hypothetical protein [Nanoarchaeota archaeon]
MSKRLDKDLVKRLKQLQSEGQLIMAANPRSKEIVEIKDPEKDLPSIFQRWTDLSDIPIINAPVGTKGDFLEFNSNTFFSSTPPILQKEAQNIFSFLSLIFPEELQDIKLLVHLDVPPIFLIKNFPIHYWGYEPQSVDVLILLPHDYPAQPPGLTPDSGIYLPANLRRFGIQLRCEHDFHSNCGHTPKELLDMGFAWLCMYEYRNWKSPHNNMFSLLSNLVNILANKLGN